MQTTTIDPKAGDACRNCFNGAIRLVEDTVRLYADEIGIVAARLSINSRAYERDDLFERSVTAKSNAATVRNLGIERIQHLAPRGRGRLVAIAGGECTLDEILVCNCCGEPHDPDRRR
jgi:hypothetical protein